MTEHRYRPEGSARELFRCRGPEVLLSGPAGTGKSRACLEKIHAMCLANPGMRGLIVRKTATSLAASALKTFREDVAAEALGSGEVRFYGGSAKEAASYQYGNGSVIVIGGLDKVSRVLSTEYDVIYVQEATELFEEDWEVLTTRLRNGKVSFQQLMADCNPGPPHHWLKRRCDQGQTVMLYSRWEDNPVLWDGTGWTPRGTEYTATLQRLTGVRRLRFAEGKWAAAEGLVYDSFDPAIHLYKHIGMPHPDWKRYWAIDFGYTNPFVCQFWAQDTDGRLFLYREVYMTQALVEDHAEKLVQIIKRGDGHGKADPMPVSVICDHDAEGRATLERKLGISTVAAKKDVMEGIEAVQSRLKVQPDGRPRLFLCRDALAERDLALDAARKPLCTQDEILEYVWEQGSARRPDVLKDAPRKENDHGMDAMRYLVATLDLVAEVKFRWMR